MPFCMDAVTLVGIVLGARRCDFENVRDGLSKWLQLCRGATCGGQGLGEWQEWLMAVVTEGLEIDWRTRAIESAEGWRGSYVASFQGIWQRCGCCMC